MLRPAQCRPVSRKAPLRGALLIGAGSAAALGERLRAVQQAAAAGQAPAPVAPLGCGAALTRTPVD